MQFVYALIFLISASVVFLVGRKNNMLNVFLDNVIDFLSKFNYFFVQINKLYLELPQNLQS